VCYLVSNIKGTTQIKDEWQQGAENMGTHAGGSKRRLFLVVLRIEPGPQDL
jgi:hypothetical protein